MEAWTILNQFVKCFILICLIKQGQSNCDLKYSDANWINDWHLLIAKNKYTHEYELHRDYAVAIQDTIITMCNERQSAKATCHSNGFFSLSLPLTTYMCAEENALQPVRLVEEFYCPYKLYKIGYNVKIGVVRKFLEVYQVCFDQKHMRPLFTINKAYPFGGSRPDFLKFDPDGIFYGNFFAAFFSHSIFKRFNTLLGSQQKYLSHGDVAHAIDRGHLTPSADFAVTNLKRATFNMLNVIPQFRSINNGNWRLIEEWIRDPSRTPANVCTGVFDCDLDSKNDDCVLKLKNHKNEFIPMYLADDRKIPIPLWSYKIVKSPQTSLVFLTLNNIHHVGVVNVPHRMCKQIACPLKLSKNVKDGMTFCCDYKDFKENVVPNLRNVC